MIDAIFWWTGAVVIFGIGGLGLLAALLWLADYVLSNVMLSAQCFSLFLQFISEKRKSRE